MPSLLDTPERVGDPVPQFPPPKQSPGVVENPEQGPFLPSVRLGGGGRSKVTASLVSKAPPQVLSHQVMHSTCRRREGTWEREKALQHITIVEHIKTGPLLRKGTAMMYILDAAIIPVLVN